MLIQEFVAGVLSGALTFLVPPTGRHLRIVVQGASDAPYQHVSVGLQINGDTLANYTWAWQSVTGGPATLSVASGGGDEVRIRVGLVPGASVGTPHASGETVIEIPNYLDATFIRQVRFRSGEFLGITQAVTVTGHGSYVANRTAGTGHYENVGYSTSPGGMMDGRYDSVTGLWWDSRQTSPPNSLRWVGTNETNTPVAVSSVTLLLDVGSWVAGTRIQIYVDE